MTKSTPRSRGQSIREHETEHGAATTQVGFGNGTRITGKPRVAQHLNVLTDCLKFLHHPERKLFAERGASAAARPISSSFA